MLLGEGFSAVAPREGFMFKPDTLKTVISQLPTLP